MTFVSLTLPASAPRHRLDGPRGVQTDMLVAGLIGAGVSVEAITAGEAYRLDGPRDMLDALAGELAPFDGFKLAIEAPPTDEITVRTSATPTHPYRRSVVIHGSGAAHSIVARGVDRGLSVSAAGANRWALAGRTAALVAWLCDALGKSTSDVHALLGLTPEIVAAEDSAAPTISVTLAPLEVAITSMPSRQSMTMVDRGQDGEIRGTTVVERDA